MQSNDFLVFCFFLVLIALLSAALSLSRKRNALNEALLNLSTINEELGKRNIQSLELITQQRSENHVAALAPDPQNKQALFDEFPEMEVVHMSAVPDVQNTQKGEKINANNRLSFVLGHFYTYETDDYRLGLLIVDHTTNERISIELDERVHARIRAVLALK